jgi:hypothetical protein
MRFLRERVFLFAFLVLLASAVMALRQYDLNRTHHAELREAFVSAHQKGRTAEAQKLYQKLKYEMPGAPTGHLIDDLARTAAIAPVDQSAVTNIMVRYHLSLKHEVEKRLSEKFTTLPAN